MKKGLIVILGIVTALVMVELIVRFVIGFPISRGGEKYVFMPFDNVAKGIRVFGPYFEYWSVEGGNRKYRNNNIGLHSSDVDIENSQETIFALGSSFIDAQQVERDKTAVGVFQGLLNAQKSQYSVLNLGASGVDPYIALYRSLFFERFYKPDRVILITEGLHKECSNVTIFL